MTSFIMCMLKHVFTVVHNTSIMSTRTRRTRKAQFNFQFTLSGTLISQLNTTIDLNTRWRGHAHHYVHHDACKNGIRIQFVRRRSHATVSYSAAESRFCCQYAFTCYKLVLGRVTILLLVRVHMIQTCTRPSHDSVVSTRSHATGLYSAESRFCCQYAFTCYSVVICRVTVLLLAAFTTLPSV